MSAPRCFFDGRVCGIIAVFVLAGCGGGDDGRIKPPELGTVTGKVTLDGKPLEGAMVEFSPATARPSFGTTDSSGAYTLNYDEKRKGAAVGEHTVKINTRLETAALGKKEGVPARYNDKSELKATVKAGENTFDWDLKSN
jgi:hypothetical protein